MIPKIIREVWFFCGPTLMCFGALFLADAVEGFGYDGTTAGYLQPLWNLVRNTVTYTLLVASLVYFLGRAARWILVPMFAWSLVCTALCVYTSHVYHVPLLWEQLSMANRVRFCHPLFSRFQFIVVFLLMPLGFKQASDVSLLFAIRSIRRACTL